MKVKEVMVRNPVKVSYDINLYELQKIFDSVPYLTLYVVKDDKLVGVIKRHDLLLKGGYFPLHTKVHKIMSKTFHKIKLDDHVFLAEKMLKTYDITSLPVVDKKNNLVGVIGFKEIHIYKNKSLSGKPISHITKKKFKYWPHIFSLIFLIIFSIFFLNVINVINLDIYGASCGEIQSGQCLGVKPLYCNDGKIEKNPTRCGCGINQTIFNDDCYFTCLDGTIYGNCSNKNLSYICLNGVLNYAPEKCGCSKNMEYNGTDCIFKTCLDGTIYDNCSSNKPLYCKEGVLINNSKKCGCPENYMPKNNICVESCTDGTIYGECSKNKPFYCYEGELISLAKTCGCPNDYILYGEKCYYKYEINPKNVTFRYLTGSINLTLYEGINDYLAQIPREIYYYSIPPTTKDFVLKNIDNEIQKKYLTNLVNEIKNITFNKRDQAIIAITLVQIIPYDYSGFYTGKLNNKYAYEVLYTNTGVCGEKSQLLAYLLRELGYGVVLFNFEKENHMAVGIKCNANDYLNTGYCFVESTKLSSIGDSYGYYVGVGQLTSTPEIIYISDGITFNYK